MKYKAGAKLLIPVLLFGLISGCAVQQAEQDGGIKPLNQVEPNPYMSTGEAVVHADPYNSDVANYPGVMGIDPSLSFSYDSENSSSLIFTDNAGNKIVPYQKGIAIRDFSGEEIQTIGSFVPVTDDGADYTLQTSYMYIDHEGNAVAPTNDGRMLILRMTDESGKVLEHFEKVVDIPIAQLAAAAFPSEQVDRNLLSLVADYKGNIWFASGGMCVYPDRYPHGFAGYVEYDAVQKLLAGENVDISAATHFTLFEGRDGMDGEAAENGISSSPDGVVVLTNLFCYLLRDAADGGVEQVWKQPYDSHGANVAAEDAQYTGGGLAWGSGTTPTIGNNLVFFTDNADTISLYAIDLQSGEVVAKQEVFGMLDAGTPTAVDNSILVYGPDDDTNIVVVGNTFGLWAKGIYTDPETGDAETGGSLVDVSLIQNGNIALQPGMVRIDVTRKQNATKYEAKTVWSSDEMKNSSVARLAAPSGRLYLYNQDTETGIWQFEVLDIEDGKTLFTVPVGESPGNNNCGAIVQIDPDGNKVSVPAADKHLWSIQDDFIRIVGDEETVVNDVTRLLPDIDQQAVGYLTGCSFESATGEVEVEIEMADINADTSKLALYAQTASGDYQKLDQELWDITEGQISVLKLRMQDNVDWDINADQGAYHIALQFVYEP